MSEEILVVGGTGTTGRRVAKRLAQGDIPFAIATRHPTAPSHRRFDWANPQSATAFEGCGAAYLIAPTDRTDHLALMRPILESAIAGGTRRFVLLSSSQLVAGGPMMGEVHAWLAAEAPEWIVLRPSWFMQNFSEGPHARTIREESVIYSATGSGRAGFISADDIAAAAFVALTSETPANGELLLTGPEALSYDEVAAIISQVTARSVEHITLDTDQLTERWVTHGLPRDYAAMLAGLDELIRAGAEDRTTQDFAQWTGLSPISFRAFAEGAAEAWTAVELG